MSETVTTSFVAKTISWLGIIFCFLLFPAFVLETSLQSLFELQLNNHRQQVFGQLTKRNELLSSYNDERKYFEKLLRKIFSLAHEQQDSMAYLNKALQRLKQNYPNQLEFIVWNNRGQIVEKLTDEKRYRYVLKKLFKVLKDVRDNILSETPINIKEISSLKENLNIVKQFLGRVFLPETLRFPYQKEGEAALILADYGRERPYFWYHIGNKFGLLVFINWELIKGSFGLNRLCTTLNRRFPDSFCGYTHISDLTRIEPQPPANFHTEILTGLTRFENIAEQAIEQKNSLMSVQLLNSKVRIFNITTKNRELFDLEDRKIKILLKLAVLYAIGLALLYFNFVIRKAFFSIRFKLLLLFLYSNLAPLAVLGFIAYDYLQHQRISFRDEISMESARLLRDFDARFEQQKFDFTMGLNRQIAAINRKGALNLDEKTIAVIKAMVKEFQVSESFLFEDGGGTVFAENAQGKSISSSVGYFKTLADGVLRYMNKIIKKADKSDMLSKITSPEDSDFIRNSIRDSRKIWPISVGNAVRMGYWNFFGQPELYINRYFLLLMWSEEDLQRIYIQQNSNLLAKNPLGLNLYVRSNKSGKLIVAADHNPDEMHRFLRLIQERGAISNNSLKIGENNYIGMGMVGNKLNQMTLCALFPQSRIEKHVTQIAGKLFAGGILSILLTSVLGLLVAHQFMKPVESLATAAKEINRQNYRYRIEGLDQDEFGHLGTVVNRVSEGLAELEIAKVVQESLFPEEILVKDDFAVYGKSVVMTTLGGDYFDYFIIDEENFGVIIGDVAGHGVGAALIMAMAKARVNMTTQEQRLDPAQLTSMVHQIVLSLKSRNLRRMMTFQYLVINSRSGLVKFCNAGHCYPICVSQNSADYIEHIGSPLGAGRKARYQNKEFYLQPGESLLLYTDGIVEAQNRHGEQLGFAGLQKWARMVFAQDCQNAYHKIFNAYVEWAGEAGDDTTIIVIGRQKQ